MKSIKEIYNILYKTYGPQGWWPVSTVKENNGYHNGDYKVPENTGEKYEIITGAVLAQNTAWKNVRIAINNLHKSGLLDPEKIVKLSQDRLAEIIKPSGYFNQKAKKLKVICEFLLSGRYLSEKIPEREELLNLWGIGPETADSILLYAYKIPVFVVDGYTKRIFSRIGIIEPDIGYDSVQRVFTDIYTSVESYEKYKLFNEYHALIVKHAKEYCRKQALCKECPVADICK